MKMWSYIAYSRFEILYRHLVEIDCKIAKWALKRLFCDFLLFVTLNNVNDSF